MMMSGRGKRSLLLFCNLGKSVITKVGDHLARGETKNNFSSGCGFLKTGSSAADSSYAFILHSHSEEKRFNRKTYTTAHVGKPHAMNSSNRASSKSHRMMRSLAY